jgi:hypothetical protein
MPGNAEPYSEDHARGLEAIREHREVLESLAETDLPAASIAKALLHALDEEDNRF